MALPLQSMETRQYTLLVLCNQGVGAVVGALSRNLVELQERQGSYLSIYDQPSSALKVYFSCKLLM